MEGHMRNIEEEKRDKLLSFVVDRIRGSRVDTLMSSVRIGISQFMKRDSRDKENPGQS